MGKEGLGHTSRAKWFLDGQHPTNEMVVQMDVNRISFFAINPRRRMAGESEALIIALERERESWWEGDGCVLESFDIGQGACNIDLLVVR